MNPHWRYIEKRCFCHTCGKYYEPLGIARHRAMHRDKCEDVKITMSDGTTEFYRYGRDNERK